MICLNGMIVILAFEEAIRDYYSQLYDLFRACLCLFVCLSVGFDQSITLQSVSIGYTPAQEFHATFKAFITNNTTTILTFNDH